MKYDAKEFKKYPEINPKLKDLLACEWDVWVENDPYLSPREKQVLRNQQPSQEDKTIIR